MRSISTSNTYGCCSTGTKTPMQCVLSYFRSYFDPHGESSRGEHSACHIARNLYQTLQELGPVTYLDNDHPPTDLVADLYVGHFWRFADFCRRNSFRRKIVFYSACDPNWRQRRLRRLAQEYNVPFPSRDFPPEPFDHAETMQLADMILLVGNSFTRDTFPRRWRSKIRLLNYASHVAVGQDVLPSDQRRAEFCYVATECGLSKGFMDVVKSWQQIQPSESRIHAIGGMQPVWRQILQRHNSGSVCYHGWIDSRSDQYAHRLQSCKFAHVPAYAEGQMGALLDVIAAGCVPITTRQSGVDDHVLAHCILVEPCNVPQQIAAIRYVLTWTDAEYEHRSAQLQSAARRYQDWGIFRSRTRAAIRELTQPSVPA